MTQQKLPYDSASNDFLSSRISEISIPEGTHASRYLLAGILRELNDCEDHRWVCWVGNSPIKPLIDTTRKQSGEHILQVVSQHGDLYNLAARALASGKSHTVVALVTEELSVAQRYTLEAAAASGGAECLLVTVC